MLKNTYSLFACAFYKTTFVRAMPLSSLNVNWLNSDLLHIRNDILEELSTRNLELSETSSYHFLIPGKLIRPTVICGASRVINQEKGSDSSISDSQLKIGAIAEMIHTASLIHDDVVDESDLRRGVPTVCSKWGSKKAVLGGDYILAMASMALARLRNPDVILLLSQVIEDLVTGEFMQLKSVETSMNECLGFERLFSQYIDRIYLKTASLFANSCRACALLVNAPLRITNSIYDFGKNFGIAFQLIDDMLDFVGTSKNLGKPTGADVEQGLITAPVLFAMKEFPAIEHLLKEKTDRNIQYVKSIIEKCDGAGQTFSLAEKYCTEALHSLDSFTSSKEKSFLEDLSHSILNRCR